MFTALKRLFLLTVAATLIITASACAEDERIQLAEGPWQSHMFHNQIAAFILEEGYGEEVEINAGLPTPTVVEGLRDGDLHVNLEMWKDNVADYQDDLDAGYYEEVATNFDDNAQGLWIPEYIQEENPGLQSIHDLPDYAHLFEDYRVPDWDPEEDEGLIHLATADYFATQFYQDKFELDEYSDVAEAFDYQIVENDAALNESLESAVEDEEAWVGYHWEPTWPLAAFDMVLLKDDQHEYDADTGHGQLPEQPVVVCVTEGFGDDYPELYDFFSNYETSADLTMEGLEYMEEEDADADEAAINWLDNNRDLWTDWIDDDDVVTNVEAALDAALE